jgi:hypothetical protein
VEVLIQRILAPLLEAMAELVVAEDFSEFKVYSLHFQPYCL